MDVRMPDGTVISGVPDNITQSELRIRYAKFRAQKAMAEPRAPEYSPTGTFGENFSAGVGKAFVDTGRGVRQLAAMAGIGDKAAIQAEVDEASRLDAPLMRTGGGLTGYIGGQVAQFAVPGGAVTRAATLPANIGRSAALGAAIANTQPVTSDQSRLTNTLIGAGGGAVGELAAAGIGRLASRSPNVSAEVAELARRAQDRGIPLRAEQVTGSRPAAGISAALDMVPFSGRDAARGAQRAGFNKAVAQTFGESADNLAVAVRQGQQRLGSAYDDVLKNYAVNMDDVALGEIDDVLKAARNELTDAQFGVIERQVNNILGKAVGNKVDGQAAYNIKKSLDRIGRGNDTSLGYHATELRDALIAALDRSLPAEVAEQFTKTRAQYANLIAVRRLVKAGAEGNVSPAVLGNVKNLRGDLKEVADIGAQFLKEPFGNSGTANRAAGLGALGMGAVFDPVTAAGAAATGATFGRGVNALMQSQAMVNAAINGSMTARRALPYANQLLPLLGATGAVASQ